MATFAEYTRVGQERAGKVSETRVGLSHRQHLGHLETVFGLTTQNKPLTCPKKREHLRQIDFGESYPCVLDFRPPMLHDSIFGTIDEIRQHRSAFAYVEAIALSLGYNVAMSDVTRILSAIERGDERAADKLLPLVYQELRRLAAAKLSQEKPGQTIQPTMLVHEAYLRLVDKDQQQQWNGRGHFFGAAAEAMRRILVENARRKQQKKRAAIIEHAEVDALAAPSNCSALDLLALDEALTEFEHKWPDKGELVKLKYFAGLTVREAAQAAGISVATAERQWTFAKTWLHLRLKDRE